MLYSFNVKMFKMAIILYGAVSGKLLPRQFADAPKEYR
jgi:hypothetical protein